MAQNDASTPQAALSKGEEILHAQETTDASLAACLCVMRFVHRICLSVNGCVLTHALVCP